MRWKFLGNLKETTPTGSAQGYAEWYQSDDGSEVVVNKNEDRPDGKGKATGSRRR